MTWNRSLILSFQASISDLQSDHTFPTVYLMFLHAWNLRIPNYYYLFIILDTRNSEPLVDFDHVGLQMKSQISFDPYMNSKKRLTVTPIAVTSAPAPAPWMIRGRGEYLLVVKETMLSDPLRPVARAWSAGYLIGPVSLSPTSRTSKKIKQPTCPTWPQPCQTWCQ